VLKAVVSQSSHGFVVHLGGSTSHLTAPQTATAVPVDPGPSAIAPELKELFWGAGAFIVFAVLMRYFLFPRLKKGMDARYAGIRSDHEGAEASRAAAKAEVAGYESQLSGAKAEAAGVVDAARQTLETERVARMATVNADISAKRAAATAANDAARVAVADQVEAAVSDVSTRAIELAVGKRPDAGVVKRVVSEVMGVGASK
jgi:F-type H+-transporting ATPase subunit b